MLIGIDGNEANVEKKVGISEYAFELLRQFSNSSQITLGSKFMVYLKGKPQADLPQESENWQYLVLKPGRLWTQWRLPLDLYLHKPRPDVFFSPTHYAPRFSPVPTVISVMDLSYLYFPDMFKKSDLYQLKNWTSYSIKSAKKVLTISQSSRFDIIREYKVSDEKVVTVYPGIKSELDIRVDSHRMNLLETKYGVNDKFILFVGTLQPRKNITRLIEAFSRIKHNESRVKDLELIVIGKKGWLYEDILSAPKRFGVEKEVKFLDFVVDEDLALFYKHARCFVFPSLYEGFGLPVLEAMKNGCPVITSNVSSLPEAGGEAALYVNPENTEDIAEKILKLIANKSLRDDLVRRGYKQAARFSWEKTARETLKVLDEIGKNK